ncbi:MAG: hypothetical protein O2856_06285, partial [Planctomycetota bacterium]|nr:hypothetical protein [Planctomycetota bacterium]
MKALYKYPQAEYPYTKLVAENQFRSRNLPEIELADTDIFDDSRYFDVFAEYAKVAPDDVLRAWRFRFVRQDGPRWLRNSLTSCTVARRRLAERHIRFPQRRKWVYSARKICELLHSRATVKTADIDIAVPNFGTMIGQHDPARVVLAKAGSGFEF